MPSLAQAMAVRGNPTKAAKAFLRVAIEGRDSERSRAAFLWGLLACEAHSPQSAVVGFNLARPSGGRAHLAAHRLEDALSAAQSPGPSWLIAAQAPWLQASDRAHLRLRAAEASATRGDAAAALLALPDREALRRDEVPRLLAVLADADGDRGVAAARELAIGYPQAYAALYPPADLQRLAVRFTPAERAARAQAWLDAGEPETALKEAAHSGAAGYVIAARAALRLRHATVAAAWAARGGESCAECWAERTDAYRQFAWAATPPERARRFADMLRAAQRLEKLLPAGSLLQDRADLLLAEALTETSRLAEAQPLLDRLGVRTQPRGEWVCRRWLYLQATGQHPSSELPTAGPGRSTRLRRLAAFWAARAAAARGDQGRLEALAASGFPDLPALWAAQTLRRSGVAVSLSMQPMPRMPLPAWASDLVTAGRVADVVFAWRAEIEAAGVNGPEWLGVMALAEMPPLDAIPLLVRGEPRLFSGPWEGLSRDLLQRYLPLPWRRELEAAAARSGVPPWVLAGLVRHESAWNARARSEAGAIGLAQVLPGVGDEMARNMAGVAPHGDLFDAGRNLTLGAMLLARWRGMFDGSWEAALACYNAGERRVREIWERTGRRGGPEFVEALEIPESWDYVHRVVLLAEGYRLLYWPEGRAFPWT
ncbi:MAG: transglycosylase SLT domain-containing protein [Thermoanaerobaculales bacterium]